MSGYRLLPGAARSGGQWSNLCISVDFTTPAAFPYSSANEGTHPAGHPPPAINQTVLHDMTCAAPPVPGDLPAEPNSVIGRERDLGDFALLLSDVRALTLCGPGGIGKTRLAV